jgi:hypothetical protein
VRERRHNVTMPNTTNATYLERREKAYTINALVRIQKYHREGHETVIHRNLYVLFENLAKTPE